MPFGAQSILCSLYKSFIRIVDVYASENYKCTAVGTLSIVRLGAPISYIPTGSQKSFGHVPRDLSVAVTLTSDES